MARKYQSLRGTKQETKSKFPRLSLSRDATKSGADLSKKLPESNSKKELRNLVKSISTDLLPKKKTLRKPVSKKPKPPNDARSPG